MITPVTVRSGDCRQAATAHRSAGQAKTADEHRLCYRLRDHVAVGDDVVDAGVTSGGTGERKATNPVGRGHAVVYTGAGFRERTVCRSDIVRHEIRTVLVKKGQGGRRETGDIERKVGETGGKCRVEGDSYGSAAAPLATAADPQTVAVVATPLADAIAILRR